ncbi:MotA/TolQ/ExbB proton channel family protein [Methylomarinovum caldicuralii]|nr:MotA/TolQ/ExbB proton channel family protein [Methylomarinovum caldicuralii]
MTHLLAYLEAGGWVMPLLGSTLFLLWLIIGYRFMLLQRGTRTEIEQLCRQILQGKTPRGHGILPCTCRLAAEIVQRDPSRFSALDTLFYAVRKRLARFETTAKALVVIAPLLGLLGTVSGMIETFDSLAEMALFRQSGGIAGGISKALFTTQMGLAVAIPGYFLLAVLQRRRKNLESDLLKLQDLLHESLHENSHA